MDAFVQFLRNSKTALTNLSDYGTIHLVMGNESCDLDSTISALSLAYFHHLQYRKVNENNVVVPVMNVSAKFFALRTETCYLLSECNIDSNLLVFKDQIEISTILKTNKVKTSIVDHHVLSGSDKILKETVVEIYDHRPINEADICRTNNTKTTISLVGSCSTLIADLILNSDTAILFQELSYLLYATIIYDTIGLNKAHGKTTDTDISVAQKLEDLLKVEKSRQSIFDMLWTVHNDTSNIKTKDLLFRDLKIAQGIPIPGLPMLVQNYLKRSDATGAIQSFIEELTCPVCVLIGIDASGDVQRDIGIYYTSESHKKMLVDTLNQDRNGVNLCLTEFPTNHKNVLCFKQGNIKLTRKFILPIVNEVAPKLKN